MEAAVVVVLVVVVVVVVVSAACMRLLHGEKVRLPLFLISCASESVIVILWRTNQRSSRPPA